MLIVSPDEIASSYAPEQLVIVYSLSGDRLFSGNVVSETARFVTLNDITGQKLRGSFAPSQELTIEKSDFVIVTAVEKNVKYKQEVK
jgi:hypothetical protein